MAESEPRRGPLRFGNFEVDLRAGELRRAGVKLKFGGQPLQVLTILLEHPGEVVTREDLQKQLWPDTFVDVDHNLNTAINKIREVLGDSAETPRFVETLPRRGYRFIAPVEGGVPSPRQLAAELPSLKPENRRRLSHYGLGLVVAAIAVAGALVLWKTVIQSRRAPKVLSFTKLTSDGRHKSGTMATDGSRIYFNEVLPGEDSRIHQVSVKGGEATPLPVPLPHPSLFDLSKDGTELLVGNSEGNGELSYWIQPVAGGSPRRVGTVLGGYARFGPDGATIIYGAPNEIYLVGQDGSSARKLLSLDGTPFASPGWPFDFRFSPDARVLRFSKWNTKLDSMDIMEAAADGTGLHQMFGGWGGQWTPDGRFFVFQDGRIDKFDFWILPEESGFPWRKHSDKPIQLTAGPLDFESPLPSKDGKKLFAIGTSRRAEVVRYDSHSGEFIPYLNGISAEGLAFTPDGQWVAYTTYPDGLLWRSRLDGSERLQLTFPPMRAVLPRWSHDAKQIAFNAILPDTTWNIYLVSSAGGAPQRILPSDQSQMDANWSPDGNSLVFASGPGVQNTLIYTLDLKSRRVSTFPGSSGLYSPRWSPDGKYIAAIAADPSQRLMLFDFATQKWTEVVGSPMGFDTWSRNGQYLYFWSFDKAGVGDILRLRLSDRKVEKMANLERIGRAATGPYGGWFGLAPDDSPLVARDISTQEIYALEMGWP